LIVSMPAPPLTPTGRVILGMIALGRQTGYEIKQVVDRSTRHFWAASYGQIYPELRRLEEQGLVRGQSDPRGGRARTVYELTPAGQDALGGWLEPAPEPMFEVRDEGMLKLFFSDVGTAEQRIDNLRAMRDAHRRTVAQLEELAAVAGHMPTGPRMTLELGLGLHRWILDWCEEAERRLQEEAGPDVD
jgi:PadR family transcriptional regulator, regulatory protein AphA